MKNSLLFSKFIWSLQLEVWPVDIIQILWPKTIKQIPKWKIHGDSFIRGVWVCGGGQIMKVIVMAFVVMMVCWCFVLFEFLFFTFRNFTGEACTNFLWLFEKSDSTNNKRQRLNVKNKNELPKVNDQQTNDQWWKREE